MATYNGSAVDDSVIAYEKGITLQQGRALRDNPIAMGEGKTGAPVMVTGWHPFDKVTVGGAGDGIIYDFAVDGQIGQVDTPLFDVGYEYMLVLDGIGRLANNVQFTISAQDEADNWHLFFASTDAGAASRVPVDGMIYFPYPRLSLERHQADVAVPVRFTGGTEQRHYSIDATYIKKARLTVANDIRGGKILMLRRREYMSG